MESSSACVTNRKASASRSISARRSVWLRTATFFQKVDLRGQAANLGVQVLNLSRVGSPGFGQGVAMLEDIRQTFDGGKPPFAQDVWVNAILRRQFADGLGFLQRFQHELGFEGGSVRLFIDLFYRTLVVSLCRFLGPLYIVRRHVQELREIEQSIIAACRKIPEYWQAAQDHQGEEEIQI
jgi:hypothetical protein